MKEKRREEKRELEGDEVVGGRAILNWTLSDMWGYVLY
jgi:hypothetical protein